MFVLPGYKFRHDVVIMRNVFMPWTLKRWAWFEHCGVLWCCCNLQTATHLNGIVENNQLQTWQKPLGNFFSSNTLHVVWCASCIRCTLVQVLCGSRIGKRLSVRHEFYVNEGVWACRNAPLKLIFSWYKREGKNLQMRHTLLYTMKK